MLVEKSITEEYQSLLCVLVIYKHSLEESNTFISLKQGLKEFYPLKLDLLVYDNSPYEQSINHASHPEWNIIYRHDNNNPGVSKAYNEGFKLATQLNKKWLLLLDQDTIFPPSAILNYISSCIQNRDIRLFVPVLKSGKTIYSPCRSIFLQAYSPKNVMAGKNNLRKLLPINSGMFVERILFEQAGGYHEKIQLDFSDFYFVRSLRKIIRYFFVMDMECHHHLSVQENVDPSSIIKRFRYYCSGARNSIQTPLNAVLYFILTLRRAIKLSIRYKRFDFLKIFALCFLKGNPV